MQCTLKYTWIHRSVRWVLWGVGRSRGWCDPWSRGGRPWRRGRACRFRWGRVGAPGGRGHSSRAGTIWSVPLKIITNINIHKTWSKRINKWFFIIITLVAKKNSMCGVSCVTAQKENKSAKYKKNNYVRKEFTYPNDKSGEYKGTLYTPIRRV